MNFFNNFGAVIIAAIIAAATGILSYRYFFPDKRDYADPMLRNYQMVTDAYSGENQKKMVLFTIMMVIIFAAIFIALRRCQLA